MKIMRKRGTRNRSNSDNKIKDKTTSLIEKNFMERCRSCMGESLEKRNIGKKFENKSNLTLYEAIRECTNVAISLNDDLPQTLCKKCDKELKILYNFRKKFQNSIHLYRNKSAYNNSDSKENSKSNSRKSRISHSDDKLNASEVETLSSNITKLEPELSPPNYESNTDITDNEESIVSDAEESIEDERQIVISSSLENDTQDSNIIAKIGMIEEVTISRSSKNTYYFCKKCPKESFNERGPWRKHLKMHVVLANSRNCPICANPFAGRDGCLKHIKFQHMRRNNNKCDLCGKKIIKPIAFMLHMETHYFPHLKQCSYCMEQFESLTAIKTHILENHLIHVCGYCGKRFIDKSMVDKHEEKHQKTKQMQHGVDYDDVRSISSVSDRSNDNDLTQSNDEVTLIENEEHKKYVDCETKYGLIKSFISKGPVKINKYSCKICPNIVFKCKGPWMKHLQKHLSDNDGSRCDICNKKFATKRYCLLHKRHSHMQETNYQCEICGKKLFNAGYLKTHMKSHYLQKDNYCRRCFTKFDNITVLKQHIQDVHSPYICEYCDRRFDVKSMWETHVNKHKKLKPYQCEQCPRSYDSPCVLRKHRESVHDCIRFDCMYCEKQFTRKQYLYDHLKIAHTTENIKLQIKGTSYPHGCNACPRRFKELDDLADHNCQSVLKFGCKKCSKRFAEMIELKEHRKEHPIKLNDKKRLVVNKRPNKPIGTKTYSRHELEKVKCPHCVREIRKVNLENHLRTHAPGYRKTQMNNPKGNPCHLCDRKFTKLGCLQTHLKTHEPGYVKKPFIPHPNPKSNICHICCKKFTRPGYLTRHLETHSQTETIQNNTNNFEYNSNQMITSILNIPINTYEIE